MEQGSYTVKEVAEMLSCTERHVYSLVWSNKLRAVRIGSQKIRISKESLKRFIAKNAVVKPRE